MSLFDAFIEDSLEETRTPAINARSEYWFAIRSDGAKGRGTREDPYNGSEISVVVNGNDMLQLDTILALLPANCVIHFGPGVFKTQGGAGTARIVRPWEPKSGQRFIGSGMFQTTLKLVVPERDGGSAEGISVCVIAPLNHINDVSVSDMTIDCDFGGQLPTQNPAPLFTCNAIVIKGKNLKVRRVRVIRWGRRGKWEGFPILVDEPWTGASPPMQPADNMKNVIEDCIMEHPDWNTAGQVTGMIAGIVQNNFFDGAISRPGPYPQIPVSSLSYSGTVVTVVTPFSHQMKAGENFIMRGVLIDGQPSSLFNGRFAVQSVLSRKSFTYLLTQSGSGTVSGQMTIEPYSGCAMRIKSLTKDTVGDPSGKTAILETYEPHYRTVGDWIIVSGDEDSNLRDDTPYNGTFSVSALVSGEPAKLKYVSDAVLAASAGGELWLDRVARRSAMIKPGVPVYDAEHLLMTIETVSPHYRRPLDWLELNLGKPSGSSPDPSGRYQLLNEVNFSFGRKLFQVAMKEEGGNAIVPGSMASQSVALAYFQGVGNSRIFERNRMLHLTIGLYHDTRTMPAVVLRNNYCFDTFKGFVDTLNDGRELGSVTAYKVTENDVTFVRVTYALGHRLINGALLKIESSNSQYAGTFRVSVISPTQFTYVPSPLPTASSATLTSVYEYFQTWLTVVTNNVVDAPFTPAAEQGQEPSPIFCVAMSGNGNDRYPNHIQHQKIFRGNLFRHNGGVADPVSDFAYGIGLNNCDGALFQENLIDMKGAVQRFMYEQFGSHQSSLNNRTSGGTPLVVAVMSAPPSSVLLGHVWDFQDELDNALLIL